MTTTYKNIYQFKISLEGIKPLIWRRIQVPESDLFLDLHYAIQDAMGWEDCHLHQFEIINPASGMQVRIGPEEGDDGSGPPALDEEKQEIRRFFSIENKNANYEYDFGDGWQHKIVLEKILPKEFDRTYPVCLAGARACPPEDCGGPWRYQDMLEIIKNPKHEEYEDFMDWLGDDFDPEEFRVSDVCFSVDA